MIRSLNTGVLGIKQFQQGLDTVGNNLANINTVGYKASRVDFADSLAQTLRAPTPDTANSSGTMGMQVGNGVRISAIKNSWTQGAVKQTGVRTDLALVGTGFFLVGDPASGALYATRAGDFREDNNGYLVTNAGLRVQGISDSVNNPDAVGDIKVDRGQYAPSKTLTSSNIGRASGTGKSTIMNFGAAATVAQVDQLTITVGTPVSGKTYQVTIDGTGTPTIYTMTIDGGDGNDAAAGNNLQTVTEKMVATINAGTNEGVTAAQVGTTGVITLTADTPGTAFTASGTTNDTSATIADNGTTTANGGVNVSTEVISTDSDHGYTTGDVVAFGVTATSGTATMPSGLVAGTAYYVRNVTTSTFTLHPTATDATNNTNKVDISLVGTGTVRDVSLKITSHGYATGNQVVFEKGATMPTTVPKLSANTAYFVRKMDDDNITLHQTAAAAAAGISPIVFEDIGSGNHTLAPGAAISSYSFGADGKINMLLTDGTQYVRGRVLLQKFANPHALMKQGSNVFTGLESAGPLTGGTMASSTTILASAAAPNSNGLGRLEAGALEMSNVDMAGEFSTLITTQRAFQANARVISASDEILQEMMALKR